MGLGSGVLGLVSGYGLNWLEERGLKFSAKQAVIDFKLVIQKLEVSTNLALNVKNREMLRAIYLT